MKYLLIKHKKKYLLTVSENYVSESNSFDITSETQKDKENGKKEEVKRVV